MEQAMSLLDDLEGFTVAEVTVNPSGIRVLVLECVQVQGCPDCGTVTDRVHSRRTMAVRDLPFGRPWLVRWDKRRLFCDVGAARDARSSNARPSWARGSG